MDRAKGFVDLVFDVVEETTNLVERTHDAVVDRTLRRFATREPARSTGTAITTVQGAISTGVFQSIRALNEVARVVTDAATEAAESVLHHTGRTPASELATPIDATAVGTASWVLDYAQASINGLWGDSLSRRGQPLDLGMTFRHHGRRLPATRDAFAAAFPDATPKVCVFVHGLAATEWLWSLSSDSHYDAPDITYGTRLRDDLGYTPIYVRYNSGRHISENGRLLAARISELLAAYPVAVEEIALVGHSMGGLVARSAAHYAREHAEPWVGLLRHVACIGSPHLGAPLEKAVNLLTSVLRKVDAAGAQIPAELLDGRSAGIKDLRHGYTIDEEWAGKDPDALLPDARNNVPRVDGVGYYFFAATISRDSAHPVGRLLGDLLVRLPSAFGQAAEPSRRVPSHGGAVFHGMNHVRLASHPAVYDALRELLASGDLLASE